MPSTLAVAAGETRREVPRSGLIDFFRHHGVWAPGVRIFRRLKFAAKAAIISVLFCIPVATLGWSYFTDKAAAIEFSAKERDGVAYIREVLPLMKAALNRPDAAAGGSAARLEQAEKRLGASLGTAAAYAAVRTAATETGDAARAHQVSALIALVTQATDGSNLTLDPDLDTYYLMDGALAAMPPLIEATDRLRAAAAGVAGGISSPEATRATIAAEVTGDLLLQRIRDGLPKIYGVRPALKAELRADEAADTVHQFHEIAAAAHDAAAIEAKGRAAAETSFVLQAGMIDRLDELLQQRIDGLAMQRNVSATIVTIGLLVAAYLFYAFYLVTHGGLREVQKHLEAMTAGDLTTQPNPWGRDEAAHLMGSLSDMQHSLRGIVREVRGASDNIVHSTGEISQGAHDLSARTEQAAANLEESASAMEQISATVKTSSDGAAEAARAASANAEVAERGGRIIRTMVTTMQGIHSSSSRIADIIGVIDGIAFQTNILALNAAVEAARAGEAGRGFAVVASEVRSLAQRCAEAAREIKGLITTSVEQVASGNDVVQQAGATIDEIVGNVDKVSKLLATISSGAREQAAGIGQTTKAVQELDTMTQQNAALVEQTAAAASSLKEQANHLAEHVCRFRLPG
jgi:methyl-accepting chemotaxis protein